MILKIEEKNANDDSNGFWLYDNLDRIRTHQRIQFESYKAFQEWIQPITYALAVVTPKEENSEDVITLNYVTALTAKDEKVVFYFSTRGYICNDNGKTLEIL